MVKDSQKKKRKKSKEDIFRRTQSLTQEGETRMTIRRGGHITKNKKTGPMRSHKTVGWGYKMAKKEV